MAGGRMPAPPVQFAGRRGKMSRRFCDSPRPDSVRSIVFGKLLFFALVGVLVYLYFKSTQRRQVLGSGAAPADAVEDMVRCAHCRVNLPRSEAILSKGEFYCSAEHQKLGPVRR